MRTGFRRRSPASRRASRSCSRPGARTSSSRSACRGSSGRSSAGRASSSAPRPRLPPTAGALGARDVRVIPSGVDLPGRGRHARGAAARPLCWAPLGGEGHSRSRRGGRRAARSSSSATARCATSCPSAVGFVPHDELGPYYERAAVVCVPSRREGYGVAAREAMAYGKAIVSTGVGGLADAIDDGVTGLVVPPGDVAALRAALEQLLGDAGLREPARSGRAREGAGDLRVAGRHRGDDRRLPRRVARRLVELAAHERAQHLERRRTPSASCPRRVSGPRSRSEPRRSARPTATPGRRSPARSQIRARGA